MTFDHLHPDVRHLASEPITVRIYDFWPRIFVQTKTVDAIYREMDRLVLRGDQARSPILLIWGDSNVGKTALLERYVKDKMEKAIQGGEVRPSLYPNIPVIMISMPADNNRTEFFELMLTKLGRVFNPYGKNDALSPVTRKLMEEVGLRLAIFDEIHNIIPAHDAKAELLRQIKELSNKIRRPMVLSGTREAYEFISTSIELKERFVDIEMPRLKRGEEFAKFLRTIARLIPLQKPSPLAQPEMVELLYNLSEGLTGRLSELLYHAAIAAVEDGTECITANKIISTIYAKNILSRLGAVRTLAPEA